MTKCFAPFGVSLCELELGHVGAHDNLRALPTAAEVSAEQLRRADAMICGCGVVRDLLADPELLLTSALSFIQTEPRPLHRYGAGFRLRSCRSCGAVYFPKGWPFKS